MPITYYFAAISGITVCNHRFQRVQVWLNAYNWTLARMQRTPPDWRSFIPGELRPEPRFEAWARQDRNHAGIISGGKWYVTYWFHGVYVKIGSVQLLHSRVHCYIFFVTPAFGHCSVLLRSYKCLQRLAAQPNLQRNISNAMLEN